MEDNGGKPMSDYYFLNECEELKRLIAENPDLPLAFFAEDSGNYDCGYISCGSVTAEKGEILDCNQEVNDERAFTSRDEFEEDLQEMLCGIDEYRNLSDEEFDEIFKKEKSKYDDKWKDCIIVYVGN